MRRWVFSFVLCVLLAVEWSVPAWAQQVHLSFLWPTYTASKVRYGEDMVSQFEAANPDIDVELILDSDPYGRMTVLVAGGTPPDVAWLGSNWHQFTDLFLPLDAYVERDKAEIMVDDMIPTVWDALIWNGVRYAVPTGYQTLATYYNKDLYNESGLAYPTDDWTVAQMISDGKAIVRDTSGDGIPDKWGVSWLYGYPFSLVHYGGPIADPQWRRIRINNPVAVEALSLWNGLIQEYSVTPINHGNLSMIENGNVGVFAAGPWLQESLGRSGNFDYDLVDFPFLEVDGELHRGSILYPEELAILKTTPHPDEAWRFLKFAISPEHLEWVAREGHIVPIRLSVLQTDNFLRPDRRMQVWYTSATYAMEIIPHPLYNDLMAPFNITFNRAVGSDPPYGIKEALDIAAEQMQAILDQYNARNP